MRDGEKVGDGDKEGWREGGRQANKLAFLIARTLPAGSGALAYSPTYLELLLAFCNLNLSSESHLFQPSIS